MKNTLYLVFFLSLISCNSKGIKSTKNSASIFDKLKEIDSIDVWTSQWKSIYDLEDNSFQVAESMYGGAIYIHNDSMYYLSVGSGLYKTQFLNKNEGENFYMINNKKVKIEFNEEIMKAIYIEKYNVWTSDTGQYKIVDSYLRQTVSARYLEKTLKGKGTSSIHSDTFLGLPMNTWVKEWHQ